jgi:ribosomal-protein-alanine N-acetyltransferase
MRIETARLVIRSWEAGDGPELLRLFSDPEVRRYLPPMPDPTLERMEASLGRRRSMEAERAMTLWAVETKANHEVIGDCGVMPIAGVGPEIELAYHYVRSAWNHGYGTEAAIACLGDAFDRLGLDSVIAICFPENIGSWRIMEKAGMRYVGLTDEYYDLKGMKKYVADRTTWRAP